MAACKQTAAVGVFVFLSGLANGQTIVRVSGRVVDPSFARWRMRPSDSSVGQDSSPARVLQNPLLASVARLWAAHGAAPQRETR